METCDANPGGWPAGLRSQGAREHQFGVGMVHKGQSLPQVEEPDGQLPEEDQQLEEGLFNPGEHQHVI